MGTVEVAAVAVADRYVRVVMLMNDHEAAEAEVVVVAVAVARRIPSVASSARGLYRPSCRRSEAASCINFRESSTMRAPVILFLVQVTNLTPRFGNEWSRPSGLVQNRRHRAAKTMELRFSGKQHVCT